MAENLVFPVKFDLSKAVSDATGDLETAMRRLQTMINSRPLEAKLNIGGAGDGSINDIKSRIQELTQKWNELSEAQRITKQGSKEFTAEAKQLLAEYGQLVSALETNARTLSATWAEAKRAVAQQAAEAKRQAAEQKKFAEQVQEAEIRRHNEASRNKLKEQAEDEKRYQKWLATKEKEVQKEQEVALKKRQAQEKVNERNTKAATRTVRNDEAVYYTNRALKAQEDIINNLNQKLSIYQQRINSQQVGSDAWNKTALEIRRITEELQKATQQMQDFQQKSFAGLSDSLTTRRVQELTQYREQLRQLDAEFNRLNQTGGAYNTNGTLSANANNVLKQRQQVIQEINKMLTTAADAQLQREKEINRVIERRKAQTDAVAAKQKAEQAAIQATIAKRKEEHRILVQQENTVANITAKLQLQRQRLNSTDLNSEQFKKIAAEVERLTKKLEQANNKVRELTGRTPEQEKGVDKVTDSFRKQETYVSRLIKRLAVYASYSAVGNFLTKIREVTAEFELQRISLGAILQDTEKANKLFGQLKAFALTSPVKFLDLTRYTKQLAAYKIGYDELFDTTKRLTDISVGLGVSMDRIILMYGQIRATGYLRASEVRQATEAGIPLVEELAKKLSAMRGEMISAADVMDMISKRAISFELVKEVFNDMTSAGGAFYNMQEKQGNTLYGMWQKLGDAAAMMFDQIGNTGAINGLMKGMISTATSAMKHWGELAAQLAILGAAYGSIALKSSLATENSKASRKWAKKEALAKKRETAATQAHNQALARNNKLKQASTGLSLFSAKQSAKAAAAYRAAAMSTNAWNAAMLKLVGAGRSFLAFLSGNVWTIALTAIAALATHFYSAYQEANKLRNELKALTSETSTLQEQSVANFTGLINTALQSPTNSKKQLEALDELRRTYGEMIPVRDLTIERLLNEKGAYEQCTTAIREYIAQQQLQKGIDKITEDYADSLIEYERKFKEKLKEGVYYTDGDGANKIMFLSDAQIDRITKNLKRLINEGYHTVTALKQAFQLEGLFQNDPDEVWERFAHTLQIYNSATDKAKGLSAVIRNQNREIDTLTDSMRNQTAELGEYEDAYKRLKNLQVDVTDVGPGTYTHTRTVQNSRIKTTIKELKKVLGDMWDDTYVHIEEYVGWDGKKMSEIFFDKIWAGLDGKSITPQLKNFIDALQRDYEEIAPKDTTVRIVRAKLQEFAGEFGVSMDKAQHYMMGAEENIYDYAKRIKDHFEELQKKLNQLKFDQIHKPFEVKAEDITNLESEIKLYDALIKLLAPLLESLSNNISHDTDERLSQLREMESSLSSIYKKYTDLSKSVGNVKALDYVTKNYASTLKEVNRLGKRFGLSFTMPTTLEDLNKFREQIKKTITDLRLRGHEKAAIELELAIAEGSQEKLQKDLEGVLAEIADGISRSKAAKEFFDKILSMTGNGNLAERLASSIFGQNGSALNREIANQLRTMVSETSVDLPDFVFYDDNSINSKALRSWVYQNKEALGDVSKDLLKFADDAENNAAKQVEGWIKATEKAKEYGDKLADVYRTTNAEIKKIQTAIEHGTVSKEDGEEMIANYERKRDEDIAKLQYEAFKDSPIYVQMFADLDNASTSMLKHMKDSILEMQSQWSNLNPTQLKELQSRLEEIDKQLTARNPFKTLADGMRDYIKLRTKGDARGNKSRDAADKDALNWTKKYLKAQEELAEIQNDPEATEAQLAGAAQMVTYTKKQKEEAEACAERWDDVEASIGMSVNKLLSTLNWAGDIATAIADISEVMGADEEDVQYWNDIADSLNQVAGGIQDIVKSAISGDVVGLISSVLTATPKMFVGFVNLFSAGKVRKANKEIRRQAELLEDLEYAYSRLETAIDKAFGANYLNNYQKQLKNLQAQQAAYEKQAAAERSKGKKEDKEKTEEYLNSARETADQIAEMQSQIAERMLGTDITSAAREFAQAWLDAYKEFGNTADAMSEKFNEMIQNMIIESVLAAAMEKALQPVFDMIDEMQTGDIYSKAFWNKLTDTTSQAAADADAAGKAVAAMFESMGLSIHDMTTTESTGIAKDISSATSEEINALAAIGNTLMYYVSPIPRMDENLAAIRSLIESGTTSQITTVEGGRWTDWQQQAMDNYNAIARNTADTVAECRRAAIACEAATDRLNKVFKTRGSKQGLSVFID